MDPAPNRRSTGTDFENQAADYLLSLGFVMLTRRKSFRGGELDLVALDGETVVFVEVKGSNTAIRPEENLTPRKRERIVRSAQRYLAEHDLNERPSRIDVIAIDREGLRHYKSAFDY